MESVESLLRKNCMGIKWCYVRRRHVSVVAFHIQVHACKRMENLETIKMDLSLPPLVFANTTDAKTLQIPQLFVKRGKNSLKPQTQLKRCSLMDGFNRSGRLI